MKYWLTLVLFIAVAGCGSAPHDGDVVDGRREAIENDGSVSDALSVSRASAPDVPVIEVPGQGSLNGRHPLLSGTGIPGATVQVMQSGYVNRVLVSAIVDADGRWAGRSVLELTPGPFSMAGRQTLDGKTSGWGLTRAFTIVEAPIAPVIENPLQSSLSGRHPLLSGTGIPGATVQVMQSGYVNRVLVSEIVGADGRWAGRSVLELTPGPFSMAGRQTLDGKTSGWSPTRVFTVLASQAVFKVVEAPSGQLNAETLGANATVQVQYPSLAVRDTVGVRLTGVALRDAPIQTVSTVGVLTFNLPKAWITENLNRSVTLTYTYKVGGAGSLITSSPLVIGIVGAAAPSDGQRVANELNQQYSTTSNTCPSNKAAFECSGVLIRTVNDSTAFHAWNPSPYAVSSGGVSFSYMKVGIGMNRLQGGRTQGFVLEPGASFTANGGYPLQVLCSFPYDGHTLNRSAAGCGASANFPSNSGACSAQGISTLATWRAHFQQYPATSTNRYTHQCSFTPDRASFALSLTAREHPDAELAAWQQNEVIIKTWPQDTSNLPIKAFIYFSSGSRAVGVEGAKNIQRDFLKMTGRRIPVIRVTPNVTTGNIFSYFAADQGI